MDLEANACLVGWSFGTPPRRHVCAGPVVHHPLPPIGQQMCYGAFRALRTLRAPDIALAAHLLDNPIAQPQRVWIIGVYHELSDGLVPGGVRCCRLGARGCETIWLEGWLKYVMLPSDDEHCTQSPT